MMTTRILPQQILTATRPQARITARLLHPRRDELAAYFLSLRLEVDAKLSAQMPVYDGKPYPLGRCQEITTAVLRRLQERLNAPQVEMERVLRSYLASRGFLRLVWGALRGRYFQNAIQLGDMYVDVSNDTVDPAKPKVEVLPMAESGLENIRDAAHFAEVAGPYWNVRIFANHVLPGLAPILPMISWREGKQPQLQTANDYMIELFRSDGFRRAEAWLSDGPPPPDEVATALLRLAPPDLHRTGDGREQAIAACRTARAAKAGTDQDWRNARVSDYLRIPGGDHKT